MKKVFALCVLTGCVGLLHAQGNYQGQSSQGQPSQGQYQGGYQGSYQGSSSSMGSQQMGSPVQQMGGISDQGMMTQIQNMLSSYQYQGKYSNVQVSVNGGNITLQGTVNSQDDKDALGSLIGGINGVRSVNNQVNIQSGSSQGNGGSTQQGSYHGSYQGSYSGSSQSSNGSQSRSQSSSQSNY